MRLWVVGLCNVYWMLLLLWKLVLLELVLERVMDELLFGGTSGHEAPLFLAEKVGVCGQESWMWLVQSSRERGGPSRGQDCHGYLLLVCQGLARYIARCTLFEDCVGNPGAAQRTLGDLEMIVFELQKSKTRRGRGCPFERQVEEERRIEKDGEKQVGRSRAARRQMQLLLLLLLLLQGQYWLGRNEQ